MVKDLIHLIAFIHHYDLFYLTQYYIYALNVFCAAEIYMLLLAGVEQNMYTCTVLGRCIN